MPKVLISRDASERFIGRLERTEPAPAPEGGFTCPVRVKRSRDDVVHAFGTDGQRAGRPSGGEPRTHWLLCRKEGEDGFQLRPVSGWYDFERPSAVTAQTRPANVSSAAPSAPSTRPLVPQSGEAELRKEATMRKEFDHRWAGMLQRRAGRNGVKVKFGKVMNTLVPDDGQAILEEKEATMHPEDERLNDETGFRKLRKKQAKALKKQAGVADNIEDKDEVPDTANALLDLKRNQGEDGWDVDDDELFSDDEPEPCEFEGSIKPVEEHGAGEPVPIGDEDEMETCLYTGEGEEVEKDHMTSHGKSIEALMQSFEEDFAERDCNDSGSGEDSDEADAPVKIKAGTADHAIGAKSLEETTPSLRTPGGGVLKRSLDSDGDRAHLDAPPNKRSSVSAKEAPCPAAASTQSAPVLPAAAVPVSREAEAASPLKTSAPEADHAAQQASRKALPDDMLRREAIAFMQKRGGRCTLKEIVRALNLNKKCCREEYDRAVVILKEFTSVDQTIEPAVLVLADKWRTPHVQATQNNKPVQGKQETPPASYREKVVSAFAAQLKKKGLASQRDARAYLAKKDGLKEPEIAEILRRFTLQESSAKASEPE